MILEELQAVIADRRTAGAESYTAQLLDDPVLAQRKIMEEAFEVCLELNSVPVDSQRVVSEAADLMYHLLVAINGAGVEIDAVLAELARRRS